MFDSFEMAPPDPILGLSAAFKADANPDKINLSVGVYKDESSATPTFSAVRKAEQRLLEANAPKAYLGIEGSEEYAAAVQGLVFGAEHEIVKSGRAKTAQTPGGTGALRVAADFLRKANPKAKIWFSAPTWSNHFNVFGAAGFEIEEYPYYDAEGKSLDFDGMIAGIEAIPQGDIVLLHGCCHNPSGVDPSLDQWGRIAEAVKQQGLMPLVDFAYQGFGRGLDEDSEGVLALCEAGIELLIAGSYSKNFGLYNERVGALTLVAASADAAQKAFSHVKSTIRANYSNPPAHGGAIIYTILADSELDAEWREELTRVRGRIQQMRQLFVETLKAQGVERDFSFITRQNGMFSFSGLTKEQVGALREKHSIYIVGSGRINVAGITPDNVERLCRAIAGIL